MFLTSALLIGIGAGMLSGLAEGLSNKAQADNQRDLYDLQKKQQQAQLERQKESYRTSAMDNASNFTLGMSNVLEGMDSELDAYNAQIDSYASQATRTVGSTVAQSAQTGFRNSGANLNAQKNTQSDVLNQMKNVYANIKQSKLNSGASVMNMQSNAFANQNSYKLGVKNAIAQTNEQIDYIDKQRSQLGYENGWSVVGDTLLGGLSGGVDYLSGGLSNGWDIDKWSWK